MIFPMFDPQGCWGTRDPKFMHPMLRVHTRGAHQENMTAKKQREKKCHRFFFQMSGLSSYPLGILIYFEDMSIIILLYTFFFGDDSSEIADESRRITLEFIGKSPKGNLFFCQSLCKAAAVMQVSWFHLQNWKQQSIWKSYLYLMNQMPNNFNNLEDFGCKIINLKKWSCFVHFSLI